VVLGRPAVADTVSGTDHRTTPERAAVVIAGGHSTRFAGGDKAVADLAGTPMLRRVADRLAPAVDHLVLNCRADQRDPLTAALDGYDHPVTVALDPDPDAGPMAGIRTGLGAVARRTPAEYAAVVACDMPFVDPELVAFLFARAAGDGTAHDAALPRIEGWYQTTQAVYRAGPMAAACERALRAGHGRIVAPLMDLDVTVVPERTLRERDWLGSFENVNTRAELREAEQRLRARE
jgi:molybdopterin-guanine dinucleotide biosynthesis protein A